MAHDQQHLTKIIEQFSLQAIPFTQMAAHLDSIQMLMEMAGVRPDDRVLDVACGPGLVACEFARHAAHVTGIDITEAMIEQARRRQQELKLENMAWQVGNALPLPFADASFSLVITRYSFHHFLEPERALAEMVRVCRPGGRVLVADVAVQPEESAAYDQMEKMRDPSHTHALTELEFAELFSRSGLDACRRSAYPVHVALDEILEASFPDPGDKDRLRQMITDDIGVNALGINARREGGKVIYNFPIAVFVGCKKY